MSFTLLAHIISATATLLTCTYAWYKPSLKIQRILHITTLISVMSGVVVTLSPGTITLLFCAKLGLYLAVVITTHIMLSKLLPANRHRHLPITLTDL